MPKISINYNFCKSCGYCIAFCPREVYSKQVDGSPQISAEERCTACELCVKRCPDFAIRVEE